ncbi:MAG: M18 family aminopeptidase [Oscillospiraceae bacterium]|nr:M18 family aminopeptidase [Oscillospiraceae bacterium]
MSDFSAELCRWLESGVSPYHTVAAAAQHLREQGFAELPLHGRFPVERGGKYYVPHGTALVAFTVGQQAERFRIAAAHTDWPCLRVKPAPEQISGGCCKLSVEPYGGAILNTWLDRPLSLAGIAAVRTDDPMQPELRLVSWDEPLLTIPNLAIHMNREVNKGVATKVNVDMLPLCRTVEEGWSKNGYLLGKLAERLSVPTQDVLSFELYVYCDEPPQTVGFERDLLSAPRLDNLTSVHACLSGLCRSNGKEISVAVLYDNEEIGSNTRHGADSAMLQIVLEKLALALGMDRAAFLDACTGGFLLSCDVAHAAHPNHMEFADPSNAPVLNGGVALKRSPRYSSDAATCAVIRSLCEKHGIPLQSYMNRADLPGGSTVGSMASALLAMPAADVGVPILAMHSARETMGARDQEALCRLCEAFFNED